jgi:hypothetical protein
MKYCIFLLCLSTLFIFSCKKKKSIPPTPPVVYDNYSALNVGNYWVYEQYKIRHNLPDSAIGKFDSCYVLKDTLIGANTYFILIKPNPFSPNPERQILRDSLHYTVTPTGGIVFSSEDFITEFENQYLTFEGVDSNNQIVVDTFAHRVTKMDEQNVTTVVPAGSFVTNDCKSTFTSYPKYSGLDNPQFIHRRYAKNAGLVLETLQFFQTDTEYTERKLIRYKVQ